MFGVLALLVLHTAAGEPGFEFPRPQLVVCVRSEGRGAPDATTLGTIVGAVKEIWRLYADIDFRLCPGDTPSRRRDELDLVITDRTLPARDVGSLGWIEFVNGRPAQTITVSTTAARMLLEASSWNGRPLLALPLAVRQTFLVGALSRSIAHEIGHYLLGSREHAARGLMRAAFTAIDILEPRVLGNRLEADEERQLKRQLLELASASGLPPPA